VLGTGTVSFAEHDGSSRSMIAGPDAPRPDWLPLMPWSLIITAAEWVPSPIQEPAGHVELLVHDDVDTIKAFYLERLRDAGFVARDIGTAPMSPELAAWFSVSGFVVGWNARTRTEVRVEIRGSDGMIFPSRAVQIHWWETDAPKFAVSQATTPGPDVPEVGVAPHRP
jgi:hypothetical protein